MPREWYWRDTSVIQNQNFFATPTKLSFFAYLASNLFSCSQIIFTLLPCNKRQKLVDCISANFNSFTCGLSKYFGMVTPFFVVFLISVIFRLCLAQDHHLSWRGQAVYISQLSLELYWLKSPDRELSRWDKSRLRYQTKGAHWQVLKTKAWASLGLTKTLLQKTRGPMCD